MHTNKNTWHSVAATIPVETVNSSNGFSHLSKLSVCGGEGQTVSSDVTWGAHA